jgi:hypothetical protein
VKQPHQIEVIRPTLRSNRIGANLALINGLTFAATLVAIVLSVSLSAAADTEACMMPLDMAHSPVCH